MKARHGGHSKSTLQSELLAQEPGVVQLKDDGLLMFCRSRDCQLVSRSGDGGETWSPLLERSNISQPTASPASIERIPSTGDLLLVWNNGDRPASSQSSRSVVALSPPPSQKMREPLGSTSRISVPIRRGGTATQRSSLSDDHVLLAHCEYPGLNSLQVTRLPVSWLYKSLKAANGK